jgi:hypothetical protein
MDQLDFDMWTNEILTHVVCMLVSTSSSSVVPSHISASVATKHVSNQRGSEPRQLPACAVPRGGHFHDEISGDVH